MSASRVIWIRTAIQIKAMSARSCFSYPPPIYVQSAKIKQKDSPRPTSEWQPRTRVVSMHRRSWEEILTSKPHLLKYLLLVSTFFSLMKFIASLHGICKYFRQIHQGLFSYEICPRFIQRQSLISVLNMRTKVRIRKPEQRSDFARFQCELLG